MEVKRICAAYWSATGNTDKTVNTIAETLAEKLGVDIEAAMRQLAERRRNKE